MIYIYHIILHIYTYIILHNITYIYPYPQENSTNFPYLAVYVATTFCCPRAQKTLAGAGHAQGFSHRPPWSKSHGAAEYLGACGGGTRFFRII